MAKYKRVRRAASRAVKRFKSYSRKDTNMKPMETLILSGVYGVARQPLSNLVPDLQMLPVGYSDNILLGGAGALAAWKGKGLIKKAGLIILANEAFIASSKASSGLLSAPTNSSGFVSGY